VSLLSDLARPFVVSRAVPPKQVADRRPGHALGPSVLQGACNLVGHWVAQEVAKDESSGRLAVLPERKSRLKVRHVDLPGSVEQRVDQPQPHNLGLASGDHRSEQSGLGRRQVAVDRLPLLPCRGCHLDAADALGAHDLLVQPFNRGEPFTRAILW